VLAAPLGPISGQAISAALNALSHGFSDGLVVCGIASLVAATTTALWLRESDDRLLPTAKTDSLVA
jgi:hypothetical protein